MSFPPTYPHPTPLTCIYFSYPHIIPTYIISSRAHPSYLHVLLCIHPHPSPLIYFPTFAFPIYNPHTRPSVSTSPSFTPNADILVKPFNSNPRPFVYISSLVSEVRQCPLRLHTNQPLTPQRRTKPQSRSPAA